MFYVLFACVFFFLGNYLHVNQFSIIIGYPAFPWQYKQGFEALLFLTAGGIFWRYESLIDRLLTKVWVLVIMVAIYGIVFKLWPDNIKVLISTNEINLIGIVMGIYASILIIYLCKLIRTAPFLEYLGKNSLVFYFLSGALPVVGSMIVRRFFSNVGILGLFVVYFISFVGSWLAAKIINRYLPWLLDLRKLQLTRVKE